MLKKLFVFLIIILVLGGIGYFVFTKSSLLNLSSFPIVGRYFSPKVDENAPANITYWSLFEPYDVYDPLFVEYQNQNPNVKISYEEKVFSDLSVYKDSLLAKLKNGEETPDIMRIHATWIPEFAPYIEPAPAGIYSPTKFEDDYFIPTSKALVIKNRVMGVPLMYDSLALFYNKEIFNNEDVLPPTTWSDFATLAGSLTKTSNNQIIVSGAAVGSADNVAHFSDILGVLMNQSNVELPRDMDSEAMKDIILFYTNFVKQQKVWDRGFAYSPLSFAQGNVAMMFGPSWELLNIIESNPDLKVGVVPVPQVVGEGSLTADSYPNFWVEVVNANSSNTNKAASWKFLKWFSDDDQLLQAFDEASKVRAYGEPFPKVSLQQKLVSNPYLGPFYTNADTGEMRVSTDLSGNNTYVDVLRTVVEGVLDGGDINDLLQTAKKDWERLDSLKAN